MDITQAVAQQEVADSILGADNIVGSHMEGTLAESPKEFYDANGSDEQEPQQDDLGHSYSPEEYQQIQQELEAQFEQQPEEQQGPEQQQLEEGQQQPEQQAQPQSPWQNFDHWKADAFQFVQQQGLATPEVSRAFANDFVAAFGMPPGLMTPQQEQALTETMVVYGMNLFKSIAPLYFNAPSGQEGQNVLQHIIGSQYEGFNDMAEQASYRTAWNKATEKMDDMPDYGTRAWKALMNKAFEAQPDLDKFQYNGQDGKPLSKAENRAKQYEIAIQIAKGQRLNPELMAQAVKTGQRLARQSQVRRSAGNLGGGTSKGFGARQRGDMDDFFSDVQQWRDVEPFKKL